MLKTILREGVAKAVDFVDSHDMTALGRWAMEPRLDERATSSPEVIEALRDPKDLLQRMRYAQAARLQAVEQRPPEA
jgi:hypothetical protein